MRGNVLCFFFMALRLSRLMLMRQLTHDIAQDLAASSGAARTRHRPDPERMTEVSGELLASANSAEAIEEQAPAPAPPRQIRITSVVDELRSAAADASVNHRAFAIVNQIVVVRGI